MDEAKDSSNRSENSGFLNKRMKKTQLFSIVQNFSANLDVLENDLNYVIVAHDFSSLSTDEQIKLDSYLSYVNSTLFWMYLKLSGSNLTTHYILHDLSRAKQMLIREKEVHDSNPAARLDIVACKRFIASGLHLRCEDDVIGSHSTL